MKLFYSYSHKDEALRDELEAHLSLLQRGGIIEAWHDRRITAGSEWAGEIDKNLEEAGIILLLISADFLASDYCYDKEMTRALEKHEAGEARVIPVIVRSVDWSGAPFSKLKALPKDGKPVTSWPNHDEAWTDVAKGISDAAKELAANPRLASSTPEGTSSKRHWNVPHPRNPFFTGREKVLKQLHSALTLRSPAALSQPQAIRGLGGLGKTQTAIEYAYRYQDAYQAVLWVKAESREALVSDFVAIAELLHLAQKEAQDQNLAVAAVKRWFETHTDWLLILDNAEELPMVREFLPSPGKGRHVLLTTRAQATGAIARRVEIDEMAPAEGALFLLRRAKLIPPDASLAAASAADRTLAEEISNELGGLPLALDQAGAYIEETPSSLSEYLALYKAHGAKLLAERGELAPDHPSVTVTFSLAFAQVAERSPAAADVLRVCAFLAPDAIPEELFTAGAAELGEQLEAIAASPTDFTDALREAGRFSLIERNPASHTLDIHRLVQEVLKGEMSTAEARLWAERTVRALNSTFPEVEVAAWPRCERLLPHVQAALVSIDQWALEMPEAARLLHQAGLYLNERARYAEAQPLYQRALAMREQVLGPEHPDVAHSLNNLANLYASQGQYAEAEPLLQRALAMREQVLGPEHPDVALSLNNLAVLYHNQGQYAEAQPLYQRALAMREQVLGPEHPDVATVLENYAGLLWNLEEKDRATELRVRAQAIRAKHAQENPA